MGYILPVERYQYNDYQRRMIKEKTDRVYIEGPFKVILEKQHEEITSEYERLLPRSYKSTLIKPELNQLEGSTYAELTGKGRAFSESI